jgi:iron-sulfur cluster repair protein YtfE (RIC family)
MDVLEHLEDEHRKLEELIAELEATNTAAEREPLLAELGESLAMHTNVEEERLYPIVEERLGADDAREANAEHDIARDDLARLVDLEDGDGFARALAQFKEDIGNHVRDEETDLFPRLRARAAADIAALGDPDKLEDEVQQDLTDENLAR